MKKKYLTIGKLIFCCAITFICLYLLFQKIDMKVVSKLYLNFDCKWLIFATLFSVLKMWLTGVRWRYFGDFCYPLSLIKSYRFYTIGTMINMILPFRIGDLLRARLIGQSINIPTSKVVGTIASEHIVDFLVLCVLLQICILLFSFEWLSQLLPTIVTFLIVIISVFILLYAFKFKNNVSNLQNIFLQYFPKKLLSIYEVIINFYFGFFQIKNLKNIMKIFFLTIVMWVAQYYWAYGLLCSLGLEISYQLGFTAVLGLIVTMGIAVMLPATPGYVGTFHLMIVLCLMQLNVPKSSAFSYAILVHAHSVGISIIVGLYSLWKSDFNLFSNLKLITFREKRV